MERQVKERLIGAAVLMAAAVILIPEMLSGPKRPTTASAPARAGEVPMKTYTIDLNRSPGASASAPAVSEQMPPAEVVENSPPQETAAQPTGQGATSEASSPSASTPETVVRDAEESVRKEAETARRDAEARTPPPQTIPESAPVKPAPPPSTSKPAPAVQGAPKPLAPAASAPTSRQWAVQLGSFASKTGAERLAKEWEDRGQKAFVMPVKSGSTTLYRVRLGPFAERAAADEALRKVGNRIAGAAVVAHP